MNTLIILTLALCIGQTLKGAENELAIDTKPFLSQITALTIAITSTRSLDKKRTAFLKWGEQKINECINFFENEGCIPQTKALDPDIFAFFFSSKVPWPTPTMKMWVLLISYIIVGSEKYNTKRPLLPYADIATSIEEHNLRPWIKSLLEPLFPDLSLYLTNREPLPSYWKETMVDKEESESDLEIDGSDSESTAGSVASAP